MTSTESEWCEYGDMRKVDCDHCRTGQKNAPDEKSQRVRRGEQAEGAAVPAVYNGSCAVGPDCQRDGQIWKDEMIVHTKHGWAHEECA